MAFSLPTCVGKSCNLAPPMAAESCNSRSLSWIVKPCRPDPRRAVLSPRLPSQPLHSSSASHAPPSSLLLSLPDDLLLDCLSRLPPSSLPTLPLVCRRFAALLDSPAFLRLRRSRGRLRRAIHALSLSDLPLLLSSASLHLDDSPTTLWDPSSVPLPLYLGRSSFSFSQASVTAVGRSIYIIGRGATLRYDSLTGAVVACPRTLFPRKKFATAVVGGKIYVAGGAARTSAVEEYDPSADAWRVVGEAPRRRYGCVGAVAGGVFYIAGGLRAGGGGDRDGPGSLDAHVCAGSIDGYHVAAGAWLRGRTAAAAAVVPGGGCVVGACGAGAFLYVLASQAVVEVSFWRWEAGRGRRAGEWTRLEPPPVPSRRGLGGAVRFSCSTMGKDKLMAVAHVSSAGEGGRRRAAAEGTPVEGTVLVYDLVTGDWSRGPDLPPGIWRAALAYVEC